MRAKWPFFEYRSHVFPEGEQVDLDPLWSIPQDWQAPSFLLSHGGLGLPLCFGFWVLFRWILLTQSWSGASFCSISWAWQSISSLFAACSSNCWSVYLFTIASWQSFLSRIGFCFGSHHLGPWTHTWLLEALNACDSEPLIHLLFYAFSPTCFGHRRGWPWQWNGCWAWWWFLHIHLTARLMTV